MVFGFRLEDPGLMAHDVAGGWGGDRAEDWIQGRTSNGSLGSLGGKPKLNLVAKVSGLRFISRV